MMHPGRVMVANKASFNIAQTMGIDAESFANPWPEDADVPEFMRESAYGANALFGDQMYALNPGFAHQDLASDFFGRGPEEGGNFVTATMSNAARLMWDMTTPFVKAPVELAAGKKLSNDTQIRQAGDYIDDQIPLLNYISKSSGVSFAGTLMNPGAALEQGRPIERSEVQRGYQESIFGGDGLFGLNIGEKQHRTLLNFALGQSAQPVDTKTQKAQKDAEAKARKAEREEQGRMRFCFLSTRTKSSAAFCWLLLSFGSSPCSPHPSSMSASSKFLVWRLLPLWLDTPAWMQSMCAAAWKTREAMTSASFSSGTLFSPSVRIAKPASVAMSLQLRRVTTSTNSMSGRWSVFLRRACARRRPAVTMSVVLVTVAPFGSESPPRRMVRGTPAFMGR